MPEVSFPPVTELLPHRGRAVLLERVLAHDSRRTVCSVDANAGDHFREADGSIPAAIGLEFMAQTVAAHGGLLDREAKRDPRPGFFLGSRRLTFHATHFERGQSLEVEVKHLRGNPDAGSGMLAFECSLWAAGSRPDGLASTLPSTVPPTIPQEGGPGTAAPQGSAGSPKAVPMVSGVLTVYLLESFEALSRDFANDD